MERKDLKATWCVDSEGQRGGRVEREGADLGDDFTSFDEIFALWEIRAGEKVFDEAYADVVAPARSDWSEIE